jgi:D-alanyl-lipoteichoic acid acyltransferase DltB (MBOAT superfamily)
MLFHSQVFLLLFLPVVTLLYYAVADHVAWREWTLIVASAVFYAWWDVRFLPLLLADVAAGWLIAEVYFRTGWRWLVPAGVALFLLVLGVFKYLDFFTGIITAALGLELPPVGIILPIGISFFTFQLISYLIDARRGVVGRFGFRRFAVVILLFPHLIAGPIVRHAELVPQLDGDPRRPGFAERMSRGLTLLVIGLATKVFLADKLAPPVDAVFASAAGATPGLWLAWTGALGFAMQIYFDFAAYSEMAIGLALMFGLAFPLNFNMPYRATTLREFWRRWHMSLSRFLRDYLYIPLGGSREGALRFAGATLVTMGLCGLWHGAGWPFVIWGLAHGIGLVVCRGWQAVGRPLPWLFAWLLTFLFTVAAFVVFRAPDLATALPMLRGMAGLGGLGPMPAGGVLLLLSLAVALALVPLPNPLLIERSLKPRPAVAALAAIVAVWCLLEVGRGQPASFIYFQF